MHDFQQLIDAALDGELSPSQADALEQWINQSEANMRVYLRRVFDHQQLRESVVHEEYQSVFADTLSRDERSLKVLEYLSELERKSNGSELVDLTESIEEQRQIQKLALRQAKPISTAACPSKGPRVIVIPRWLVFGGAIAAVLGLTAGLYILGVFGSFASPESRQPPSADAPGETTFAYLISSENAEWSTGEPGFELRSGQVIELTSGQAELRFASTTVVQIYAGTRVEIQDENRCRMTSGRLVGNVPGKAIGFEVEVPGGLVRDLGTNFSVEIDPSGRSTVQVEKGSVSIHAQSPDGDRTEQLILTAGMDGAIDPDRMTASVTTRIPLELANTGVGIASGNPDPNWFVTRISTDPEFTPQPASVSAPVGPDGQPIGPWQQNNEQSKWLLVPGQGFFVPDEQRTTFRYQFTLPQTAEPEDLSLVLRVWVDNKIEQVRINGQILYDLDNPYLHAFSYSSPRPLVLNRFFTAGDNTVDIVIANGTGQPKPFNPSAFRAEWEPALVRSVREVKLDDRP